MAKVRYDYGDGSWNDPVRLEPLCIRCNMLDEDCRAPDSPDPERMTLLIDTMMYATASSPRSVMGVADYSHWSQNEIPHLQKSNTTKTTKKKGKMRKKKLFRRHKQALPPLQTEEPLNMKMEEKSDFLKLREEESERPRWDTLSAYPMTLMEQVLNIPVLVPTCETDDQKQSALKCELQSKDKEETAAAVQLQEEVRRLKVSQMELRHFLSDKVKFSQLQKEVRAHKSITNGILRQKLHVFCRTRDESEDVSELRDIFSEPASRGGKEWNKTVPLAYRRMNELSSEIDWSQSIEEESGVSSSSEQCMQSKKKWSDARLLNLVTNYSKKGRESHYNKFQDGVEEKGMLDYCTEDSKKDMLQEGVQVLKYCARDLIPIVEKDEDFANLQRELRKIGAVTNGVLKQGLHFYVRDIRLKRERERAKPLNDNQKEQSENVGREISVNDSQEQPENAVVHEVDKQPERGDGGDGGDGGNKRQQRTLLKKLVSRRSRKFELA